MYPKSRLLSLVQESVSRITDRPAMTLVVDHGHKTLVVDHGHTCKLKQPNEQNKIQPKVVFPIIIGASGWSFFKFTSSSRFEGLIPVQSLPMNATLFV